MPGYTSQDAAHLGAATRISDGSVCSWLSRISESLGTHTGVEMYDPGSDPFRCHVYRCDLGQSLIHRAKGTRMASYAYDRPRIDGLITGVCHGSYGAVENHQHRKIPEG